jgi:hypothetical protein
VVKLALAMLALAGCASVELAPMRDDVRTGPARSRTLHRVVALPATCGSLQSTFDNMPPPAVAGPGQQAYTHDNEIALCQPQALTAIDQLIRSQLDFAGYDVIDAEKLNMITATRHEVIVRRGQITSGTSDTIDTRGSLFEDATPHEQREILVELGADGVLATRVWFGTGMGTGNRHDVTVQVQLAATVDRELAWAHRCKLEIAVVGDAVALDRVARCAITGARP